MDVRILFTAPSQTGTDKTRASKPWRRSAHSQASANPRPGLRAPENMRSDPGIFDFAKWLRVGEEGCPTLEQAKARLKELYPSKPGWPDTTLVINHSKRMAVNAAANRALAPQTSKLLQLETQVIHIDLGCYESVTLLDALDEAGGVGRGWGQRVGAVRSAGCGRPERLWGRTSSAGEVLHVCPSRPPSCGCPRRSRPSFSLGNHPSSRRRAAGRLRRRCSRRCSHTSRSAWSWRTASGPRS